jgi:Mrp family chromosome partitioning ATPase
MRLIERAMRSVGAASAEVVDGSGPGTSAEHNGHRVNGSGAASPVINGTPQRFKLISRHLARQGFITPQTLGSQLALEIGGIKRSLLRRLDFFHRQGADTVAGHSGHNVVLVTSAKSNDGKTFTAVNLALSLVLEEEVNVMLIDADMYTSKVAGVLDLEVRHGLSDRLQNSRLPLADCLFREETLPLTVLPAGKRPRSVASLFGEREMAALMREVAKRYPDRLVIIDGPPLLATTEATVLVPYADQVVLVVPSGDATQDLVTSALDALAADDKVSMVLNRSRATFGGEAYGGYARTVDS